MATYVYAAGGETTEETEFNIYAHNTDVNATNPKSGSRCFVLNYNYINVDGVYDIACTLGWNTIPSYRNWAVHFQLRLEGTPSNQDVAVCFDEIADDGGPLGDVKLYVTTARKLKVTTSSGSTTGSTVLNTGTYYQIELRVDKTGEGKVYLRINEADELNRAVANNAKTNFTFGHLKKSDTLGDPAVVFRIDDLCLWTASAGETPPWLNTTNVHYRTVDAAGNYDQYGTQTPSGTAHLNVDDYATSDGNTSHNTGGTMNATERQTHNLVNATPSGTLKGFTVFSRSIDKIGAGFSAAGTRKLSIRQDSTDYETAFTQTASDAYKTELVGYGTMPDGTDITAAGINGLDVGSYIKQDYVTTTTSIFLLDINEPHETMKPSGDGADDGSFTTSTGGANAWDHVEDLAPADWITSSTNGHKQGFTHSAPNTTGMSIGSVRLHLRAGRVGGSGTISMRGFYRNPSGTYFYTNTVEVSSGTVYYHPNEWQTNPDTGSPWVGSEISGGQFGVELVDIKLATSLEVYGFNINIAKVSGLRETSYWVVTAHGDVPTEFGGAAVAEPLQAMMY